MTDYGLDARQFCALVVRPTLVRISLHSIAAERLVLGTFLHESHLRYIKQINGPALGLGQMEGPTHRDLHRSFLAHQHDLRKRVLELVTFFSGDFPDPGEMVFNMAYAVAMCRVHYRRVKESLPAACDAYALSRYWKQHYNTPLGRGTVEQALPHFEFAVHLEV